VQEPASPEPVEKASAPALNFQSIGATGLQRYGTYLNDEWHKKLQGRQAIVTYREMKDQSAVIGALVWAIEALIRQAPHSVKPAGDQPEEQRYADHVTSCLDDMSHTWASFISELVSMVWGGFSCHELVYKLRRGPDAPAELRSKHTDGLVGWRKLPIRSQDTIDEWQFQNDGGVSGCWQRAAPNYRRTFLPIESLLLFRVRESRGSPTGYSMCRPAWRTWFFLKRWEEIHSIGFEKDMTGVLKMTAPPEYFLDNATTAQKSTIENLRKVGERARRGEYECMVVPAEDYRGEKTGFAASLMQSGGRTHMDGDAVIKRLESRLAMVFLGDQLLLGQQGAAGSGASFALHSGKTLLFSLAIKAIMDSIDDVLNRFAIPRLMRANGWPLGAAPHHEFGDIETDESPEFASAIAQLTSAGALVTGRKLEEYIRTRLGIPEEETIDFGSARTQDAIARAREADAGEQYVASQRAADRVDPLPAGMSAPLPGDEQTPSGAVQVPEQIGGGSR